MAQREKINFIKVVYDNNDLPTPCIINGWFSPTYENPRGFSIRFLFAKLGA